MTGTLDLRKRFSAEILFEWAAAYLATAFNGKDGAHVASTGRDEDISQRNTFT